MNPELADEVIRIEDTVATVHHLRDSCSSVVSSQCEYVVRLRQIPPVVEQLKRTGGEAAWVVFMFKTVIPSVETTDDYLNLQYSVCNGIVGMEWVLLGPRNIADKNMLTKFIRGYGHKVAVKEMNGVSYLRVEDGDITQLGMGVVQEFYGIGTDVAMGLLVQGFQFHQIASPYSMAGLQP